MTIRRICGSCTGCCTALGVTELQKPVDTPCAHACGGCKIYDARPRSCRDYSCAWLHGVGSLTERPDKLGVVIDAMTLGDGEKVFVRELWKGAAQKPQVVKILDRLAGHYIVLTIDHSRPDGLSRRVRGPEPLIRKLMAQAQQRGFGFKLVKDTM